MAGKHPQGPNPAMFSNVVIAGGTFHQHNVNSPHRGLDLLQQATASGAFHNSGERYDPPKCHPNTRLAVMKTIMDWTLGLDEESRGKFIMWLTGAAGAGKSAILQSFAEQQDREGRLLASFFFGKSDSNRNHVRKLVATIAYQIHAKIPYVRHHMIVAIEQDPLIFTRSLITQFTTLIIQPLRDSRLLESRFFDCPRVIIIDGLDECIDHREQKDVLLTVFKVTKEYQLPILFLISSRPEHDISTVFSSSQLQSISTRLDLDERFSPDKDIELYLRHEFNEIKANHPFRRFLPSSWPSDEDVQRLVRKSSGQFIYAATIVKYVGSTRHRPHHRLEVVLSIRPFSRPGEQPFAELDALYTHILIGVAEDSISVVLRVLCFIFDWYSYHNLEVAQIETILQLEPGQVSLSFCDLGALISVVENPNVLGQNTIKILHASIRDFLLNRERSRDFHIHNEYIHENMISCVRFLSTSDFRSSTEGDILWFVAAEFFRINIKRTQSMFATSLLQELKYFSIPRFYESAPRTQIFHAFHNSFLPAMLSFLKDSDFQDLKEAQEIYKHHLRVFKECFLSQLMEVDAYHSKTRCDAQFALHLALVCHSDGWNLSHGRSKLGKYATVPSNSLDSWYKLHNLPYRHTDKDPTDVHYQSKENLVYSPFESDGMHYQDYINLISHICPSGRLDKFEFEGNPALEKSWREFGKEVFAGAARCSFEYLCGNQIFEKWGSLPQQKIGFNAYFTSLRRNWPSKWRRNFGNKGSCKARKKWQLVQSLKNPRSTVVIDKDNPPTAPRFLALRRLKSRPIYPQLYFYRPFDLMYPSPSVWGLIRYKKYLFALGYLILFLPMAGKSESLLQLLRTKAFSQRCCEYPKLTKKARRVIDNYLARMDARMSE